MPAAARPPAGAGNRRGRRAAFATKGSIGIAFLRRSSSPCRRTASPRTRRNSRCSWPSTSDRAVPGDRRRSAATDAEPPPFRAAAARARVRHAPQATARRACSRGAATRCALWLEKSRADLALLTTELPTGPYPCAGIPWFSTPFGRDGIITALQTLWFDPSLARGVLAFLAENQAREYPRFQDAAPGKIIHEMRKGEMAAARRSAVPLVLRRRGQHAAVRRAGRRVCAAHRPTWRSSTRSGRRSRRRWPGSMATATRTATASSTMQRAQRDRARPIRAGRTASIRSFTPTAAFRAAPSRWSRCRATCTRRGTRWPWLADATRRPRRPRTGGRGAQGHLRRAVEERFWMPEARILCDRAGWRRAAVSHARIQCRPAAVYRGCRRRGARRWSSSNSCPRHSTTVGGSGPCRSDQPRFNPMSYHNGSIWPHDTALCARGHGALWQSASRRACC